MKMATMRNRVRAGVLLTLSMVVPLLLVMTNATAALSQTTVTVRVSNLDEPSDVTLSQATSRVGSALLATLDDPDGWVLLSAVQWSRADTADGPFTVLSFKYISSPRRASYTPEAADEGKFLKVTLFYIDRQCRVVNSFNDQCRKMAETTSDNAVAAAQSDGGDLYATGLEHAGNGSARHHRDGSRRRDADRDQGQDRGRRRADGRGLRLPVAGRRR